MDSFDAEIDAVFLNSGDFERRQELDKSGCLTPISIGNDLSMLANKGSMSLSIDELDMDEDEATLSAATTPIFSEACYCCPTHAVDLRSQSSHENDSANSRTNNFVILVPCVEKEVDAQCKEMSALHASINIPASDAGYMKQDTRLRKFETITQSTSNSNFPFESNTLKRVPNIVQEFDDATLHTQSCINLKSESAQAVGPRQNKNTLSLAAQGQKIKNLSSTLSTREPDLSEVQETHIFHSKTQSMDAEQFFNEFILMPANTPSDLHPYFEHN